MAEATCVGHKHVNEIKTETNKLKGAPEMPGSLIPSPN
jgi:hypothetical protein